MVPQFSHVICNVTKRSSLAEVLTGTYTVLPTIKV